MVKNAKNNPCRIILVETKTGEILTFKNIEEVSKDIEPFYVDQKTYEAFDHKGKVIELYTVKITKKLFKIFTVHDEEIRWTLTNVDRSDYLKNRILEFAKKHHMPLDTTSLASLISGLGDI